MNNLLQKQSFYNDMGFRLKQIRQIRQLSQNDLADMLGVVRQTIQKYENGEVKMSPDIIQLCANAFNIPIGYFYGEGQGSQTFTRTSMMIASEVMMLPDEELQKTVYRLVKQINTTWRQGC